MYFQRRVCGVRLLSLRQSQVGLQMPRTVIQSSFLYDYMRITVHRQRFFAWTSEVGSHPKSDTERTQMYAILCYKTILVT
jgi:hypothetical protein